MQWLFPALTLFIMPFSPESPYFILTTKKDPVKARHALDIQYGGKWISALIDRRLKELQVEIEIHEKVSEGITWKSYFRAGNLERTWLTFAAGAT